MEKKATDLRHIQQVITPSFREERPQFPPELPEQGIGQLCTTAFENEEKGLKGK